MAACIACGSDGREGGNLCLACAATLVKDAELCPEQVASIGPVTNAGSLVDQWGRAHRLGNRTVIGRDADVCDISILQGSISRQHAEITHDPDSEMWLVSDLESTNGTYVAGERVGTLLPLSSPSTLFIGDVGFYFAEVEAAAKPDTNIKVTKRRPGVEDPDALPMIPLRLTEPTGGGGGFVALGDKRVQLTATQFAFVRLLATRITEEASQPGAVRGFVRSSELTGELPWDTPHPDDNHVKQLVRRVRKALARSGIDELIESRHRFGYRLTGVPK